MKLYIIGSSSRGNCYLLVSEEGEALMVECGVALKKSLVFSKVSHIDGCIVTHEHGDHAKHVRDLIARRIPLYMSKGTADALGLSEGTPQERYLTNIVASQVIFRVNKFSVMPFDTKHDAAEPFGYLIRHPEMGTTLFATDTYFLKYRFPGLNNIMIECNYELGLVNKNVDEGVILPAMRNRVIQSHMSLQTCKDTLMANDLSAVNNIVLIHLSGNNGDGEMFKREIEELTGKNTIVARQNMVIDFNKYPF